MNKKIIISLGVVLILSILSFVYAGDLISIKNKIVTYTGTLIGDDTFIVEDGDDYIVWERQENLNRDSIENDISNNNIEINKLENELKDCSDIKIEEYKVQCEIDIMRKIDFIMGENIMFETKLEKIQ